MKTDIEFIILVTAHKLKATPTKTKVNLQL